MHDVSTYVKAGGLRFPKDKQAAWGSLNSQRAVRRDD